jgi:peptidoglycan/LPS O-acetylase OafA/YrhL
MKLFDDCDPRARLLQNLQKKKIPGLDGIRGIAALAVVGFHEQYMSSQNGWHLMSPGRFSVQIFFVISGMLITWLLLREEQRDGEVNRINFYWRRALRLLPALFALLLWQDVTHLPAASRGGMISTALYCANYFAIIRGTGALDGLGQTWSLAVEEHFYLIWPQVFLLVRDRRTLLRVCFGVMGLQIAWRLAAGFRGHFIYAELSTETASCAAVAGCALALLLWSQPERLPRWLLAPWLAPVSLIVILALAQAPRNAQLWWGVPLGIPFAAVIVLQAVTYEWRILENPVMRYLGRISYSVYLWGMVAIALTQRVGHHWTQLPVLAMVIALGTASYFLVERPVQSIGRRWLAAREAAIAVATT